VAFSVLKRIPLASSQYRAIKVSLRILLYPLISLLTLYSEEIPLTNPARIGHLFLELDCFLKEQVLGRVPKKKYLLVLDPSISYANPSIISFLKTKRNISISYLDHFSVEVINSSCLHPVFRFLRKFGFLSTSRLRQRFYSYVTAINSTASCFEINSSWGDRPPIFTRSSCCESLLISFFNDICLDYAKPYVLIHAREGGYSVADEHFHYLRNVDIRDFYPAVKALTSLGLNVIRIGDPTMATSFSCSGYYDYALSKFKSPRMDVVLGSSALFFLGTPSGAPLLSSIFGIPIALCNISLPFSYSPLGCPSDLGIPKLVGCSLKNSLVPFSKLFRDGIAEFRTPADFAKTSYYLVPNSSDDIRDLAIEMYKRVLGVWNDNESDAALQSTFSAMINEGSYSHGSASKCSTLFMRKYSYLISGSAGKQSL